MKIHKKLNLCSKLALLGWHVNIGRYARCKGSNQLILYDSCYVRKLSTFDRTPDADAVGDSDKSFDTSNDSA